ncbi:SLM1 family PH domain-containing protein [Sporobolomyces koalae]|uniref:SLM1 family PH domain-containing protein n=1 Tax=Sporobolomyces koalae TaxID=500713 RepID=UPI00316B96E4
MNDYAPSQNRPRSVATGVSRRSSVTSRQSQLIKKNTGPHELRPSDILIERFSAWKRLVKNLITYFEGIADIESNTAKELTKLGGVIQVPFREGNQFLGEGGVQDIFYGVRERTRLIADHHANLAKTVEGSIVQHLQKLRTELKAHIKNIQQDTGKLAASVAKEREISTKMITDLARSITMLKNTPMGVHAKEDPWYTNSLVARQLQKQVHEENSLQKSIIIMQQNSEHFEEGVVRAIQMAWSTFDEWNSRASSQVQETWATMGQLMRSVAPTTEWIAFASRSEYLLDPDTPLRNPMTINYPGKDDPSVIPVHQGILERKKRYTKTYKESFYILTPAGYLHEHLSSDLSKHPNPELSLFLPECTLGAPTNPNARSHKFHIEGKKTIGGDVGQKSGLFARDASFTFRARSHDEMLEWWNDCKQLSKVYLTASEPFDRSGPVPAAVRAAGYVSEEEESEEEDGSSVEEEDSDEESEYEEDETDHRHHHHHHHQPHHQSHSHSAQHQHHEPAVTSYNREQQPQHGGVSADAPRLAPVVTGSGTNGDGQAPPYSVPTEGSGIQLAENGYAAEKKGSNQPGGAGNGEGPSSVNRENPRANQAESSEEETSDEEEEDEEETSHGQSHFVEALNEPSSSSNKETTEKA